MRPIALLLPTTDDFTGKTPPGPVVPGEIWLATRYTPEGGYRILATVQGRKSGPRLLEDVAIVTDHPIVPAVYLRVAARITGPVQP